MLLVTALVTMGGNLLLILACVSEIILPVEKRLKTARKKRELFPRRAPGSNSFKFIVTRTNSLMAVKSVRPAEMREESLPAAGVDATFYTPFCHEVIG